MNLKLTRPLAIFDLEATGINITQDRICEIAIIRVEPDGTETRYIKRVNPGIPIPPEVSEIHGITDEDVKNESSFKELAAEISAFIEGADLVGYNSNKFDIPMLAEEFLRAEFPIDLSARKFVDVQNIFHKMEQRTLVAAYRFYCEKELDQAHSAMHDTEATWEVLKAQLDRYKDLNNDIDFLCEFSRANANKVLDFAGRIAENDKGQAIYNFGKHKGKTLRQVAKEEPGYYGWMLDADFPLYTKQVLREQMEKIKAENAKYKERKEEEMQNKLEALKNKFK